MVIQCSAIQPHLIWDKHHTEPLLDQIFGEHFIYDTCIFSELYAQKSAAVVFLYWHGKATAYLKTALDKIIFYCGFYEAVLVVSNILHLQLQSCAIPHSINENNI